jgi:hypothetical protein
MGKPMTPETRKTLLDLIAEYGNALERIQGEKDLLKAIEARAVVECEVTLKAFKTIAAARWADTVTKVREDLEARLDLFDTVRAAGAGERATVEFRDAA